MRRCSPSRRMCAHCTPRARLHREPARSQVLLRSDLDGRSTGPQRVGPQHSVGVLTGAGPHTTRQAFEARGRVGTRPGRELARRVQRPGVTSTTGTSPPAQRAVLLFPPCFRGATQRAYTRWPYRRAPSAMSIVKGRRPRSWPPPFMHELPRRLFDTPLDRPRCCCPARAAVHVAAPVSKAPLLELQPGRARWTRAPTARRALRDLASLHPGHS